MYLTKGKTNSKKRRNEPIKTKFLNHSNSIIANSVKESLIA